MNLQDISLATITLARDEKEEKELRQALAVLASLSLPVVVSDGGSTDSFLNFLSEIKQFTVLRKTTGGLLGQVNDGLHKAYQSERPFIFYTEPDKKDFFQHHLMAFLQTITVTEKTGVVLASRSEEGLASFPPFQRMTETTINNCCEELMQKKTDYCYGPFLMSRSLVPYLSQLNKDAGWGWRPFVFNTTKRLGLSVDAIAGNFFCPPQQQEENSRDRIHRMKQLEQNIRGLVFSTTIQL